MSSLGRFFLALFVLAAMNSAYAKPTSSPIDTLRVFYKNYLDFPDKNPLSSPQPPYSRDLKKLMNENEKLCASLPEEQFCGWGEFDTEFYGCNFLDEGLNYTNSDISIIEIAPGKVRVSFNEMPVKKARIDVSPRQKYSVFLFTMILEDGEWRVNDMARLYDHETGPDEHSVRSYIKNSKAEFVPRAGHTTPKVNP